MRSTSLQKAPVLQLQLMVGFSDGASLTIGNHITKKRFRCSETSQAKSPTCPSLRAIQWCSGSVRISGPRRHFLRFLKAMLSFRQRISIFGRLLLLKVWSWAPVLRFCRLRLPTPQNFGSRTCRRFLDLDGSDIQWNYLCMGRHVPNGRCLSSGCYAPRRHPRGRQDRKHARIQLRRHHIDANRPRSVVRKWNDRFTPDGSSILVELHRLPCEHRWTQTSSHVELFQRKYRRLRFELENHCCSHIEGRVMGRHNSAVGFSRQRECA
jgi:hypothetical protein